MGALVVLPRTLPGLASAFSSDDEAEGDGEGEAYPSKKIAELIESICQSVPTYNLPQALDQLSSLLVFENTDRATRGTDQRTTEKAVAAPATTVSNKKQPQESSTNLLNSFGVMDLYNAMMAGKRATLYPCLRLPLWRKLVREILFWKRRDAVLWPAIILAVAFCLCAPFWMRHLALVPIVVVVVVVAATQSRLASSLARMEEECQAAAAVMADDMEKLSVLNAIAAERRHNAGCFRRKEEEHVHHQSRTDKRSVAAAASRHPHNDQSLLRYFLANANWPMTIYLLLVHLGAVAALYRLLECKGQTLAFAFALWPFTGMGITAGVHRLWSHRSYQASWPVRCLLMAMNSMANQGTIFHWARDHRVHHRHSETAADPHDATRGFFFAHMGWLLVKKDPKVIEAGKKVDVKDLKADWVVMLQERLNPFCQLFFCFFVPAALCRFGWGESWGLAVLVPGVLRYVVVLHFTWCVNSVAHMWGGHPYDDHSQPAENGLVSLLAQGEGWHNWHHAYPHDYAASELGVSAQFNPTKLFIDACAAVGLVSGRKRAHSLWQLRKEARVKRAKQALAAASPRGGADHPAPVLPSTEEEDGYLGRYHQVTEEDHRAEPSLVLAESLYGPPMFRHRAVGLAIGKP